MLFTQVASCEPVEFNAIAGNYTRVHAKGFDFSGYPITRELVSFHRKTEPATKPTNVGNINVAVQRWTLPVVANRTKEIPLAAQQSTPLALAWAMRSRFLSINEPTIANNEPSKSAGKKDSARTAYSQSCVL